MSALKQKSNFNIEAAVLLKDNNLFAPSVHCSYYSCLQLMKVAINDFVEITYDEQEAEIKDLKADTHKYIIDKISDQLFKFSREEHALFNRKIKELKGFRKTSDYKNVQITIDQSNQAILIAQDVRARLIENFHV